MNWTTWDPAPIVLLGAAVALVLFAGAFLRLRRSGGARHACVWRAVLFVFAVVLATLPLVSPLDRAGDDYLLSVHMFQHVLLGDAAPALALVALRGPLLFFFPPRPMLRVLARSRPLRGALSFLLRPRVSVAVWALVIGAWHVPAAYDYALAHPAVHDVEHLSFVVVGLLVWAQLVDPARRSALRPSERYSCMVAMLLFGLALGGLLVAAAPLYPTYAHQSVRLFGISPTLDQQLAGVVMIVEQIVSLSLCAICLAPKLGRRDRSRGLRSGSRPFRASPSIPRLTVRGRF